MKDIIENIVKKNTNFEIKAIIPYGSTVYKNKNASDHDFIVLVNSDAPFQTDIHSRSDIDISIYDWNTFIKRVHENKVRELELIFTPFDVENYFVPENIQKEFLSLRDKILVPTKMRKNFSSKTSNSYVKAKKKIIIPDDYDYLVSLKSLWHSIRMADFAIQMVTKGKVDFQSCNDLYKVVEQVYSNAQDNNKEKMWEKIHSELRPLYNEKSSKLKLCCPKG